MSRNDLLPLPRGRLRVGVAHETCPFGCLSLLSLGLVGCGGDDTTTDDTGTPDDSGTTDTVVDFDEDGVPEEDDCDDADASLGAVSDDGDCDGALTDDDCDDSEETLNADDADGDGSSSCDGDCDDHNSTLNVDDADADGYSTCDDDCNDAHDGVYPYDSDGDGVEDACGWRQVSAGHWHSCALDSSGSIECWGIDDGSTDDYGQVSDAP